MNEMGERELGLNVIMGLRALGAQARGRSEEDLINYRVPSRTDERGSELRGEMRASHHLVLYFPLSSSFSLAPFGYLNSRNATVHERVA